MDGKQNQKIGQICDSLLTVLTQYRTVLNELEQAICEETTALVNPSRDTLGRSNHRKENCLLKARMLEEASSGALRRLAEQLAVDPSEVTVSRILPLVDEGRRNLLEKLGREVRSAGENVIALNNQNRQLIEASLAYVAGSLAFIDNLLSGENGYSEKGRSKVAPPRGRVLKAEG